VISPKKERQSQNIVDCSIISKFNVSIQQNGKNPKGFVMLLAKPTIFCEKG
jgi:hypothetical protein